jgi:hypothetical protein
MRNGGRDKRKAVACQLWRIKMDVGIDQGVHCGMLAKPATPGIGK